MRPENSDHRRTGFAPTAATVTGTGGRGGSRRRAARMPVPDGQAEAGGDGQCGSTKKRAFSGTWWCLRAWSWLEFPELTSSAIVSHDPLPNSVSNDTNRYWTRSVKPLMYHPIQK